MHKSSSIQNNVNSFKNYISHIWKNEKPLCKLFSTEKNGYLYDTATNKICKCEKHEFELLSYLIDHDVNSAVDKFLQYNSKLDVKKAIISIERMMKQENILKITKIDSFGLSLSYDSIIDHINNKLRMIQLEITEKCNLRCRYCVYNENYEDKRNHGYKDMTEDIALKAIKYLKKHSKDMDRVTIGFYGGEPLLKHKLIKKVVNFSKKILKNKKLNFSITTNATLINKEIAHFLYSENFDTIVSLDGPKEIHDLWRKDTKNNGSFERTYKGLEYLHEAYENYLNKLSFSMVYAPPYSELKVESIAKFISSIEWLPNDFYFNITYPQAGSVPCVFRSTCKETNRFDFSLTSWAKKRFLNDYKEKRKSHLLANTIIEEKLARLLQRPLITHNLRKVHMNGCCIPGARRTFITATGNMKICERIGDAPYIGNVNDGLYYETIKKYYCDEYSEKSIKNCSSCWFARLCTICYQHAFNGFKIDMDKKNSQCYMRKLAGLENLRYFCTLMEINDKGLDYLYEWEIT